MQQRTCARSGQWLARLLPWFFLQLHQSRLRPVVVVSEAFTPEYAQALRSADGIVAIETRAGDAVVPDQMLRHAPQVALVDAQGKITAVPNSDTPLELFLRLGGKQE
ncbi:MAG: hypothetical protein D6724_07945 [Armatimonadetes bacterium]|nr:MAG: hypothetical protein D6724_07945 [Armatimonadota bacterium]